MTTQFTDILLKQLKPRDARYDVRERDGFLVRVFPSGEKSFQFVYQRQGHKRRMTLGTYPNLSLQGARRAHRRALELLAEGKDPADHQLETRQSRARAAEEARKASTVNALADDYLERYAKPRKRTWAEDARILERDVRPAIGTKKAAEVTRRDVLIMLDRVVRRGSPIQANRTLAVVRKLFNWAVGQAILDHSPATLIKAPAPESRRDRVLSDAEIKAVWTGIDATTMELWTRQALRLAALTGQRIGEVVGMEWNDIEGDWWTIPAEKTKNKLVHRVPLSPTARGILDDLRAKRTSERFVLPGGRGPDRHITVQAVARALSRWLSDPDRHPNYRDEHGKDRPVDSFTPHDLRRTVGTRLGELGFNRLVQDRVLNHKDNTVGGIYDRYSYDREKRAALEAWERRLLELSGAQEPGRVIPMRR